VWCYLNDYVIRGLSLCRGLSFFALLLGARCTRLGLFGLGLWKRIVGVRKLFAALLQTTSSLIRAPLSDLSFSFWQIWRNCPNARPNSVQTSGHGHLSSTRTLSRYSQTKAYAFSDLIWKPAHAYLSQIWRLFHAQFSPLHTNSGRPWTPFHDLLSNFWTIDIVHLD
jgi:hypothetical protein